MRLRSEARRGQGLVPFGWEDESAWPARQRRQPTNGSPVSQPGGLNGSPRPLVFPRASSMMAAIQFWQPKLAPLAPPSDARLKGGSVDTVRVGLYLRIMNDVAVGNCVEQWAERNAWKRCTQRSRIVAFGRCAAWPPFLRSAVALAIAVGCAKGTTDIRDVLRRPSAFTDTTIVVSGRVSSDRVKVPLTELTLRYLTDAKGDTLPFLTSPDTFAVGSVTTVTGRVYFRNAFGVARFGPILVAGDLTRSAEQALLSLAKL